MSNHAILIVTHKKDLAFFECCARSIKKFVSGFDDVKCVVPLKDIDDFAATGHDNGVQIAGYGEPKDKGFLGHMQMKCYGDHHFPKADTITHIDADCIFLGPVTPKTLGIEGSKPPLVYAPWEEMPDAVQFWRTDTERALGVMTKWETMRQMPITHRRQTYQLLRERIEQVHGRSFDNYLFSCKNEYPQTFCEFNLLGGVAQTWLADSYRWIYGWHPGIPLVQFWSHGGFDRPMDTHPMISPGLGSDPRGPTPREVIAAILGAC